MAKKKKGTTHHKRRRRVGAAGNETLEMFLGATIGGVGAYILQNTASILPSIQPEVKSLVVLGGAYFVPKLVPGVMGTGIGLGMAAAGAIELSRSMGFVTGVMAGIAPGNSLAVVNGQRRLGGVMPGKSLAVVNGSPRNKIAAVMAGVSNGYYN